MTNSDEGGGSRDGDKPSPKKTTTAPPPPPPPTSQTLAQIMNMMTLYVPPAEYSTGGPVSGVPPPLPPPPPPPSAAAFGVRGKILVGGEAGGSGLAPNSADISDTRPMKRKSAVVSPEGFPPVCTQCKRRFDSPKALFGHLRSHPERPWRGAYPPPGFEDDGEMDRADIDLNELPESSDSSSDGEVKNDFDLNKPPNSDN